MSKRAILYTRVSTDEQALHGYSLGYQFEKLKAYCTIHGIEEVAHYQDDHSAKSFERPEFKKLLEFIRQNKGNIDLLLFIKWDRFSRNASESYEMLGILKKLKIEAQAIEQPLDLDIPENKLMLALFLASPEVENDRRSLNTKAGIRRAMKEGRWCVQAPKGYDNKRDDNNKPIIVPNKDAFYIKQAFELIKTREYATDEVRKKLVKQGFSCSKGYFSTLLKNPIYIGKIYIKADKDERECIVNGQHQPIITEELFYAVQDVLNKRYLKANKPATQSKRQELPLRGFLRCPRCGRILTGSASKGHGGKYYYYHCSNGCRERFRASMANQKFLELLHEIKPREEINYLYDAILKDLLKESESGAQENAKVTDSEIKKLKARLESLQDKYADNHIGVSDYNSAKQRYESQLRALTQKKKDEVHINRNVYDQLVFSFSFLKDLPYIFSEATVDVQQRIIGSIFNESLTFSENIYRTSKMNSVVELICSINKPFGRNEKGQFSKKTELSCQVASPGIEPGFKV